VTGIWDEEGQFPGFLSVLQLPRSVLGVFFTFAKLLNRVLGGINAQTFTIPVDVINQGGNPQPGSISGFTVLGANENGQTTVAYQDVFHRTGTCTNSHYISCLTDVPQ
jgi:hypothetical protein